MMALPLPAGRNEDAEEGGKEEGDGVVSGSDSDSDDDDEEAKRALAQQGLQTFTRLSKPQLEALR